MRRYQGETPAGHVGTEDFIVRRVRWAFTWPDDGELYHSDGEEPVGELASLVVECEMAIGPYSSTAHVRAAGRRARKYEVTAF
jgi:hypothetical protein